MKDNTLELKEKELIRKTLDNNINQIQNLLDETVNIGPRPRTYHAFALCLPDQAPHPVHGESPTNHFTARL